MFRIRWNNVEIKLYQCCFNVVSASDTDVVSTLWNVENPTSDFVSFSTSDQRYFNFDLQRWNNVDPTLKCWLGGGCFLPDRNSSGGGIILFFREEVPSKLLSASKPNSSVGKIFIELNLRSKKWHQSCSWSPNLTFQNNRTQNISRVTDFYPSKYDNFIVLGDFNCWNFKHNYFWDLCKLQTKKSF